MPVTAPLIAQDLADQHSDFVNVRKASLDLVKDLSAEDMNLQSMEDASPAKWHLGHTSWFFETFVLRQHVPGYTQFNPYFAEIFNSYYVSVGARHARNARGLLSRPSAQHVFDYRAHVDAALKAAYPSLSEEARALLELGLHHERQHQELLLTDTLHAFSFSPLLPALAKGKAPLAKPQGQHWHSVSGGLENFGHSAAEFAFDNEGPAHQQMLASHALSNHLVTNGNWLEFIADGGYNTPLMWLSDGWTCAQAEGWNAPLYWQRGNDDAWQRFSAYGLIDIDPNAPVCHISYYEADAFARWAGYRLPTEFEMEHAARNAPIEGNFVESGKRTPIGGQSLYGDLWAWTQSPYMPYPRYKAAEGAVGEYNGKFMANQMVLRGGSCFTPKAQMRPTYRNFFYPHQRWQMTGLRLARDL